MKHILLIFLLLPSAILANGQKTPKTAISFHLEGEAAEAPKFARLVKTIAGEKYFRVVPEVSTKDIISFNPFPADDKATYGLVFKLNDKATRRLHSLSNLHQGKLLIALINGQARGVVNIDRPIKDGILVIWSGIQLQEIKLYDKALPRIGETEKEWKARLKAEKKKAKK